MEPALESWNNYLRLADFPWCYWCGRGTEHRPSWWGAPWLVERAHIVNNPRRKDRHAAVLLCSWCHRLEHGEVFSVPSLPAPSLQNMLWMKKHMDPKYYKRKFLVANTVASSLPFPKKPPLEVLVEYVKRRPGDPDYMRRQGGLKT